MESKEHGKTEWSEGEERRNGGGEGAALTGYRSACRARG